MGVAIALTCASGVCLSKQFPVLAVSMSQLGSVRSVMLASGL